MSAFSECLNKCVKESNFSKNYLISACRVNRSTFFQCLNGKRMPTEPFFESLIQALQVSPGEEAKLRELYFIAQIGESVYISRCYARKCLETIAALPGEMLPQIRYFRGETQLNADRASLCGANQVFQELCYMVQAEMLLPKPKIDLFLPCKNSTFFEYLKLLYRESDGKTVCLRQMVQFSQKQGEKAKDSLEFFDSILFFLASNCTGYEAYYYYTEADFSDAIGVMYPYSLVTSKGAMLLNESMDRALFSSSPEILETCHRQFDEAAEKGKQFYMLFNGYEHIAEVMAKYWAEKYIGYHYFASPCLGIYLTDEIVEKYRPEGLDALASRYYQGVKSEEFYSNFCSERGIMDFARTGRLAEYPQGLIRPLEPADRKVLLEEMLYRPPENSCLYLVDEKRLPISNEFVFSIVKDQRIFVYRKEFPKLRMYCFREKNLLDAFVDYFSVLPESKYVLPQSELERVLREAIDCCEQKMQEEEQGEKPARVGDL